jgi:hypothetical protein
MYENNELKSQIDQHIRCKYSIYFPGQVALWNIERWPVRKREQYWQIGMLQQLFIVAKLLLLNFLVFYAPSNPVTTRTTSSCPLTPADQLHSLCLRQDYIYLKFLLNLQVEGRHHIHQETTKRRQIPYLYISEQFWPKSDRKFLDE